MKKRISILSGKVIRKIAKLRGGGSALPGLFMEKIDPNFVSETLSQLPHGVVVISGTNGRTTTTKMVVELLEGQGLRVFTNKTGSNFVRGVAAAILENVDFYGKLPADIAVLELDEAHATHFVKNIQPRFSLILNVMRDQLDRFGEIDYTASLLKKLGEATSGVVVLNGDDRLLSTKEFSQNFKAKVIKFGTSDNLVDFFPNDDELHETNTNSRKPNSQVDYMLEDFSNTSVKIKSQRVDNFKIQIGGIHNVLNLTAAIGLVYEILQSEDIKLNESNLKKTVAQIKPAFGRGETIRLGDQEVEIMLVKNPAGFRSNLKSADLENAKIMIAINDNYADGRDMSWLWDVDFSCLQKTGVAVLSGVRAYDMALRLIHDEVDFNEQKINPKVRLAIKNFLSEDGNKKKIFATYTAMLEIRKEISKLTDVEKVL